MKTNRSNFFQTLGSGSAGFGLSAAWPLTSCQGLKTDSFDDSVLDNNEHIKGQRTNWPIRSELKSKRIRLDAVQNQISWTFTKQVLSPDEFDYIFPGHFMVNLENQLLVNILETLNEVIADPHSYDYDILHDSGEKRMHKFTKGFGTIAYTENGVYPPRL